MFVPIFVAHTCWCPKDRVGDTDEVFPFRDTKEDQEVVASVRKNLMDHGGQHRERCKNKLSLEAILTYTKIYMDYRYNIPNMFMECFKLLLDIFQI